MASRMRGIEANKIWTPEDTESCKSIIIQVQVQDHGCISIAKHGLDPSNRHRISERDQERPGFCGRPRQPKK